MGCSGCTVKYAGEDKSGMVGKRAREWCFRMSQRSMDGIVCSFIERTSTSRLRKLLFETEIFHSSVWISSYFVSMFASGVNPIEFNCDNAIAENCRNFWRTNVRKLLAIMQLAYEAFSR